ncbi:lipopolysaccharide heptosyltransferase I [Chitinibacter sp. SCUT-21]|uniref:lipopolysaccharide heptosyltransferase I n=1 Tax=Chitinibacter sp. SCUT-21 TaxID=2970891 RepID=UPI0035A65742
MQRILVSKITSLGDVLFTLPMITDIRQHFPEVKIDWVVDQSFASLPALHPAIDRVIAVPLRGLKKKKLPDAVAALRVAIGQLREQPYDLVIDCHGMIKSALLSRTAKAKKVVGPPNYRLGEAVARFAYHEQLSPAAELPAIEWYREFAALALGYQVQGLPQFGLSAPSWQPSWLPAQPYVMCFHAASKSEKTWPISAWVDVLANLEAQGIAAILPWGATHEHEVANLIAQDLSLAVVAPPLSVSEIASLICGARAVIGVDTGMTHLAESLEKPTIALYTVTDPNIFHPYWNRFAVSLGGNGQVPSVAEVLEILPKVLL